MNGTGSVIRVGLADDPDTQAIACYMEAIQDGERFAAAVKKARENGKPSAVPWTSTKRREEVMTTFMSTLALLSSL